MKKILSTMLSLSMLASVLPIAAHAADDGFSIAKKNWTAGTSGAVVSTVAGNITYSSGNSDVVTVNEDGTFTAQAAGTTTITPSVDGVEQSPIPITVQAKGAESFSQNMYDDVIGGKLITWQNYGEPVANKRKGTKLFAWLFEPGGIELTTPPEGTSNAAVGVHNTTSDGAGAGAYLAFFYKLEGEVDSAAATFYKYGETNIIKDRVTIGFLTDDTKPAGCDWNDPEIWQNTIRDKNIVQTNGAYGLSSDWTIAGNPSWELDGQPDGRTHKVTVSDVPTGAEYMAVFVNLGTDESGKTLTDLGGSIIQFNYVGADVNYSTKMLGEVTADKKIAMTFNKDINSLDELSVKVNGTEVSKTAQYDALTYTAFVDGFNPGDIVVISTPYGDYNALIPSESEIEYDSAKLSAAKTNIVEGTSTELTAKVIKDGTDIASSLEVSYVSDSDAVSVSGNTVTAVKEGKANITLCVNGVSTDKSVEINTFAKAAVSQNMYDDISGEKLIRWTNYGEAMANKRNGTKLFALLFEPWGIELTTPPEGTSNAAVGVHNTTSDESGAGAYLAFFYKLEGEVDSAAATFYKYGETNIIKDRVTVGFLTDDTKPEGCDWNDPEIWQSTIRDKNIVQTNGAYGLSSDWTIAGNPSWDLDGQPDGRTHKVTVSDVPSGAKYMAVFVNLGTDESGKTLTDLGGSIVQFNYVGADITYVAKMVAGEATSDGKIALTFNKNLGAAPEMTVTVNGVAQEKRVVWNANDYTAYISGFNPGDDVQVTTSYGSFAATIVDNREGISEITVDEVSDGILNVGATSLNANVKLINVEKNSVVVYAALYNSDRTLKSVACSTLAVNNGSVDGNVSLNNITTESGDILKIFCWDSAYKPFKAISNVNSVFTASGDF